MNPMHPSHLFFHSLTMPISLYPSTCISAGIALSLALHLTLLLSTTSRPLSPRPAASLSYASSAFLAVALLAAMAAHEHLLSTLAPQPAHDPYVAQYAIWAPLLLLQWGALDGITAFSLHDAELWRRHAIACLVQLALAILVVALNLVPHGRLAISDAAWSGAAVLAAACVKCAERVTALRFASRAALSTSCLAIYEFMRLEPWLQMPLRDGGRGGSPSADSQELPCYNYAVTGELYWYARFLLLADDTTPEDEDDARLREAARRTPQLVTLHDILSAADISESRRLVLTCVAFSLFKLFRRRLAGLYMYEWRQTWKTPHFFLSNQVMRSEKELLSVLDMELRFLYDSLYTKFASRLAPRCGIWAYGRVLTTALLATSAATLITGVPRPFPAAEFSYPGGAAAQKLTLARLITWLLLSSALAVEAYQLTCLVFSDWTRVWLACTFVKIKDMVLDVDESLQQHSTNNDDDMNATAAADLYWEGSSVSSSMLVTESLRRQPSDSRVRMNSRMNLLVRRWVGRCAMKMILQTALLLNDSRFACISGSRVCRIGQRSLLRWDRATTGGYSGGGAADKRWWRGRRCWETEATFVEDEPTVNEFRQFVVKSVTEWCADQYSYTSDMASDGGRTSAADIQNCAAFSSRWVRRVCMRMPSHQRPCLISALGDTYTDFDHLLINWHIATSVCYLLDTGGDGSLYGFPTGSPASAAPASGVGTPAADENLTSESVCVAWLAAADVENKFHRRRRRRREPEGSIMCMDKDVGTSRCNSCNECTGGRVSGWGTADLDQIRSRTRMLSEYMMFLLTNEAQLLPCHADVARGLTEEVRRALRRLPEGASAVASLLLDSYGGGEGTDPTGERARDEASGSRGGDRSGGLVGVPWRLEPALQAARRLMQLAEEERWRVMVGVWMELLITAAASSRSDTSAKAKRHLECRRRQQGAAELISLLWLLLGHMGFAEMQL